MDNVEHFYCIGGSVVETRNGSSQVLQQQVWDNLAGHYIDSLAQIGNNTNPGVDDDTGTSGVQDHIDEDYYALQDQQFNVLAITDDQGDVVERYEYTLYGERVVMNDYFVPFSKSNYGIQLGFQGLWHDDETTLIYNRARMLNPVLSRFMQRDPLGYPDGMNTYAAYHVMRGGVDPWGLWTVKRDNGFTAIATPDIEAGDTISGLADYVGLDSSEFKEWLTLSGEDLLLSDGSRKPLSSLAAEDQPCEPVEVPNQILAVFTLSKKLEIMVTSFNSQVKDLRAEGFMVNALSTKGVDNLNSGLSGLSSYIYKLNERTFLDHLKRGTEGKFMHGLLIEGHGRAGYASDGTDNWKVTYKDMLDSMSYKFGAVLLNVCNGGWCAADNPQEGGLNDNGHWNGQWYGPPWTYGQPGDPQQIQAGGRDLVSSNGVFSGLRRGLTPPIDNIDVSELFPGDTQGTK